jgi:hypothetical protein
MEVTLKLSGMNLEQLATQICKKIVPQLESHLIDGATSIEVIQKDSNRPVYDVVQTLSNGETHSSILVLCGPSDCKTCQYRP